MKSLNSMIKKLSPTNLYNLSVGGMVYAELAAFGEGLDILRNELDQMTSEAFVQTASSYGLEELERLVGAQRGELSTKKRREMLISRLAIDFSMLTPKTMDVFFKLLGAQGRYEEFPTTRRIVVDFSMLSLGEAEKNWIRSQAISLLPAHLECDVVFKGTTWSEMDAKNMSFQNMDNAQMTWSKIDILD